MRCASTASVCSAWARHLAGRRERLLDLLCFPLTGREDALTRLPGHRVRRFYIDRCGRQGRLHFFDGTPTAIMLDLNVDDPRVLRWVGLTELRDGERQWFDLAAQPSAEPGLLLPAPKRRSARMHPSEAAPSPAQDLRRQPAAPARISAAGPCWRCGLPLLAALLPDAL